MITKSLVKKMIMHEVTEYLLKHPEYKVPTPLEAEMLDNAEHRVFFVDEDIDGRLVVYDKLRQCYKTTHPLFQHDVVLVKKDK